MKLRLKQLTIDPQIQSRAALDAFTIDQYASSLRRGENFPPITVFCTENKDYLVTDGFHRVEAHRQAGLKEIETSIVKGTRRDAVLYSACANTTHGRPRSNADKRHAVCMLLQDPEWKTWSDAEIGRRLAVSDRFVAKLRDEPTPNGSKIRKVKRGDAIYEINTARIGASRKITPKARDILSETTIPESTGLVDAIAGLPEAMQFPIAAKLADGCVSIGAAQRLLDAEAAADIKAAVRVAFAREFNNLKEKSENGQVAYKTAYLNLEHFSHPQQVIDFVESPPFRQFKNCFGRHAHLYLKTPNGLLSPACRLLEAFGFRQIATIALCSVLAAPRQNAFNSDFLLFGVTEGIFSTKGGPRELSLRVHSDRRKEYRDEIGSYGRPRPDDAVELIEALSPGPYLRLFYNKSITRKNWHSIGSLPKVEADEQNRGALFDTKASA